MIGYNGGFVYSTGTASSELHSKLEKNQSLVPIRLHNGMDMPPRYQKLLTYFTEDILASLSTHPSIHQDLRRGLLPIVLGCPHLLSASLALSAAGLFSRGITKVDGADISKVIGHLQSSGLSLLRKALKCEQTNDTREVLLVTCLIWCLADVFAARRGMSSWKIHLQGVTAMIDEREALLHFVATPGLTQSALRHLYLLYLSLQTLPYLPAFGISQTVHVAPMLSNDALLRAESNIDGFLGYDEKLLDILQEVNLISSQCASFTNSQNLDCLLGRLKGMILRDERHPPKISISAPCSPEAKRDFLLCHQAFQQATLIHLYRLYHAPSGSKHVLSAVNAINMMINKMTQGQACHTWVAMSMPLFTIGCEAFNNEQQNFVRDKIQKLEACIGSLHVRVVQMALEDIWEIRNELGDHDGRLCAGELLGMVRTSKPALYCVLTHYREASVQCNIVLISFKIFVANMETAYFTALVKFHAIESKLPAPRSTRSKNVTTSDARILITTTIIACMAHTS